MLPHAEFGANDDVQDAPHFIYKALRLFQDKTIVLIFESDQIDRTAKDDQIATRTLTKWISKDETVKISENKGLISRIANIPLILC